MKAKVKLTISDLYKFYFYHMYIRPVGLVYLIVGVLTFGGGIFYLVNRNGTGIFFILISCIYFFLQPIMLYFSAARQLKLPIMQNVTYYEISDEGIRLWQDGLEPSTGDWKQAQKVVRFLNVYLIYFSKVRANVVPESSIEGSLTDWEEIFRKNLTKKQVRGFKKVNEK